MKTQESTPEMQIEPYRQLKIVLHYGNISLHLKKIDGTEMIYTLNVSGAYFDEDIGDYVTYQVVVNTLSDYDLDLK